MGNMGIWQILLILAVILLIFGAARLPALAKSVGQSARAFKGEMKQMRDEDKNDGSAEQPQTTAQPTAAEADQSSSRDAASRPHDSSSS